MSATFQNTGVQSSLSIKGTQDFIKNCRAKVQGMPIHFKFLKQSNQEAQLRDR